MRCVQCNGWSQWIGFMWRHVLLLRKANNALGSLLGHWSGTEYLLGESTWGEGEMWMWKWSYFWMAYYGWIIGKLCWAVVYNDDYFCFQYCVYLNMDLLCLCWYNGGCDSYARYNSPKMSTKQLSILDSRDIFKLTFMFVLCGVLEVWQLLSGAQSFELSNKLKLTFYITVAKQNFIYISI